MEKGINHNKIVYLHPNLKRWGKSLMNKNNWFVVILAFLLGVTVSLAVFKKMSSRAVGFATMENGKLTEVLSYIDKYYLDTVNRDALLESAIQGMLSSLDPHSTYATATQNKEFMEDINGAFEGVGIQFNIMNDTLMVIATVSGGPSEKAGIRAGDRIVTVDDVNIAGVGITSDQVFKSLRGKKGTTVKIGIMRKGFNEVYSYQVTRDVIPTYTVDVAYMLNGQTGYIKVNQFGENTYNEFITALGKLKQEGMQSLVLDLRGNPGGYLLTAINICDVFLPKGEMIVYTEGAKVPSDKMYATERGGFETGKLVVLVDDFSASASEIVAGAVQDNDRGWVVGRRSFGKGLVQQQFILSDNSSLKLTVARYHTPSGRCIQREYVNGIDDYYGDLIRRFDNGEMDFADSIKFDENLKYKTKNGRIVYGGGGIMPDFFVPLDRDSNVLAFNQMYNSGLMVEFAFHYANEHKADILKKYPHAADYVSGMQITEQHSNQFIQFYQQKTKQSYSLNETGKNELKIWLKALIGRNLYQEEGFYPVINATDKTILKALEVIKTNGKTNK